MPIKHTSPLHTEQETATRHVLTWLFSAQDVHGHARVGRGGGGGGTRTLERACACVCVCVRERVCRCGAHARV